MAAGVTGATEAIEVTGATDATDALAFGLARCTGGLAGASALPARWGNTHNHVAAPIANSGTPRRAYQAIQRKAMRCCATRRSRRQLACSAARRKPSMSGTGAVPGDLGKCGTDWDQLIEIMWRWRWRWQA